MFDTPRAIGEHYDSEPILQFFGVRVVIPLRCGYDDVESHESLRVHLHHRKGFLEEPAFPLI